MKMNTSIFIESDGRAISQLPDHIIEDVKAKSDAIGWMKDIVTLVL